MDQLRNSLFFYDPISQLLFGKIVIVLVGWYCRMNETVPACLITVRSGCTSKTSPYSINALLFSRLDHLLSCLYYWSVFWCKKSEISAPGGGQRFVGSWNRTITLVKMMAHVMYCWNLFHGGLKSPKISQINSSLFQCSWCLDTWSSHWLCVWYKQDKEIAGEILSEDTEDLHRLSQMMEVEYSFI